MKFIAALSKAFRLEGESLTQFSAEVKKLTDQDRKDLLTAFEAEGWDIDPGSVGI